MTTPVVGYTSGTNPFHCFHCGYDWVSKQEHPKGCSRCSSERWDDPIVKPSKRVMMSETYGQGMSKMLKTEISVN
jgi:hypothetical protein